MMIRKSFPSKTIPFPRAWFGKPNSSIFSPSAFGLVLGLFLLSGCASIRGPKTPTVFLVDKETNKDVLSEVQIYRDGCKKIDKNTVCTDDQIKGYCLHKPTGENCRADRDTIIYDLKKIIDHNYESYARTFEQTQDSSIFAGEVSAASLTAVATLVGASDLKDILTTASTLVQATSTSVQKNFYQKQTSYSILNVMNGDRAKEWATIYDKMERNGADNYSLGEAMDNLIAYRQAGDAIHALASIQQSAANTKDAAANKIKKIDVANQKTTPE
jgi:hypothetical protein